MSHEDGFFGFSGGNLLEFRRQTWATIKTL